MAVPTDEFTWATDTNHTDPGEAWDGTVTKTAPSAGLQATGYLPTQRPAVNTFNWLMNVIGQWVTTLKNAIQSDGNYNYPDGAKTGVLYISPHAGLSGADTLPTGIATWVANGPNVAQGRQDESSIVIDLNAYLPDGCSFSQVFAYVTPGDADDGVNRLTTHRMELKVFEVDHNSLPQTPVQLGSTDEDDGTIANQLLSVSFTPVTINKLTDAKSYIATIRTGDTASVGGQEDSLFSIGISVSVPGPRGL